jgi:putative redox protein
MSGEIIVTLVGGKRVDAQLGRFTVHTDQPPELGGQGGAPDPYALFLASLATCAGMYVVAFCQARNLPTEGIRLVQRMETERATGRLSRVTLEVQVPSHFPDRYREAVARAAAACKVKKILMDPPELQVTTVVEERAVAVTAA